MGSMNNMFTAFDKVLKAEQEQERLQHEQAKQNEKALDFLGSSKGHEDEPEEVPNGKQQQREDPREKSLPNENTLNDNLRVGNVGVAMSEEMKESFRAETFEEVKESEEQ